LFDAGQEVLRCDGDEIYEFCIVKMHPVLNPAFEEAGSPAPEGIVVRGALPHEPLQLCCRHQETSWSHGFASFSGAGDCDGVHMHDGWMSGLFSDSVSAR
jgi:hypothetical protein